MIDAVIVWLEVPDAVKSIELESVTVISVSLAGTPVEKSVISDTVCVWAEGVTVPEMAVDAISPAPKLLPNDAIAMVSPANEVATPCGKISAVIVWLEAPEVVKSIVVESVTVISVSGIEVAAAIIASASEVEIVAKLTSDGSIASAAKPPAMVVIAVASPANKVAVPCGRIVAVIVWFEVPDTVKSIDDESVAVISVSGTAVAAAITASASVEEIVAKLTAFGDTTSVEKRLAIVSEQGVVKFISAQGILVPVL